MTVNFQNELRKLVRELVREEMAELLRPNGACESNGVKGRNPKPGTVAIAVRDILRASDGPISRKEMMHRLVEEGFRFVGADHDKILYTMLWREGAKHGIAVYRGVGYGLVNRDGELPQGKVNPFISFKTGDAA